jgi:hypothetical protein
VPFDPGNFPATASVTNPFLPWDPGMQWVLTGTADGENHRVVTTVTDLTKPIDGVSSTVIWDRDFASGELIESELAFQAQDVQGNVWNLGEYPEEFEEGEFVGAPSTWIAGLAGAQPGIAMLADPQVGTPEYLQGRVPPIDFFDCGRVTERGVTTCVPAGCFDNVLVVTERNPLEPQEGEQLKYHAPGVGVVRVGAVGDPQGEVLRLVRIRELSGQALERVNEAALQLERRAYRVSDVYAKTEPIDQAAGDPRHQAGAEKDGRKPEHHAGDGRGQAPGEQTKAGERQQGQASEKSEPQRADGRRSR